MNRSQKRLFIKKLKLKGFSEKDIETLLKIEEMKTFVNEEFFEGEKVKLKYDEIVDHPDFKKNKNSKEDHIIRYQKFIEDHKNEVLTVKYDKNHINHPSLIVFEEDDNEDDYKWLMWTGYLQKVKEEKCD